MRKSGILMPIASLPGKYGIGTFGRNAYRFVDRLQAAGQSYWQILPLGPTGYGDSPYQAFSTFAGNPYFIDLELLIEEGLLTEEECNGYDFGSNDIAIDYEKIYLSRFHVLRLAYERSNHRDSEEYKQFICENAFWLDDYALYMAVKNANGGVSFIQWEDGIRFRKPEALENCRNQYADEVDFFRFQQFVFFKQWNNLKRYANERQIQIIGDIPIYVAFDSADTWANPSLFQFDENGLPIGVAGCPPDGFSATGQLWGNPLYRWDYHKSTGYAWWISRIKQCYKLYDVIRIDHFRGFDEYYAIPYGDPTAENGRWQKGPGYDLFIEIKSQLGDVEIIAEDLGFLTDTVLKLVEDTGFPGMKVLQFAFDSREESDYLPHNYKQNCVVYTGTHDNDTILGWYDSISDTDRNFAIRYLNNGDHERSRIPEDYIRLAMGSVAKLCIIPIQDYLGLGKEGRINIPSTPSGNWCWRMRDDAFSEEIAHNMYRITRLYSRL